MKFRPGYIILFLITGLFESCCGCDEKMATPEEEKPVFTFAVAGHIYGNPDTYTSSVYPPFLKQIKKDHAEKNFRYLFLTGDVVAHSTNSNWNTVTAELDSLGLEWHIAPGNHDLGLGYVPAYGGGEKNQNSNQPFHFMDFKSNVFLVLNTSNSGWTVDSTQQKQIRDYLKNRNVSNTNNILVFTHQLWWERNSPEEFELDSLRPNSFACYDGTSDFWQDVFPYFDSTGVETWFFAGDMGAHYSLASYYEDHYENFHFYGSGMGGGIDDNYLIVEVYQNGRVDIQKVSF